MNDRNQWLQRIVVIMTVAGYPFCSHAGFNRAADAEHWCEQRVFDYLKDRGYKPYNWTATTYLKVDDYITDGAWRVGVDDVKVVCTARKGGKKRSGEFKILDDGGLHGLKPVNRHRKSRK